MRLKHIPRLKSLGANEEWYTDAAPQPCGDLTCRPLFLVRGPEAQPCRRVAVVSYRPSLQHLLTIQPP